MSSRSTHVMTGCLSAFTFYMSLVEVPEDPMDLIILFGAGHFGGRMPDLLEPATNPHHRKFFHGLLVLLLLAYGIKKLIDWAPRSATERVVKVGLIAAAVGYASHLLLDSLTPRSIPIVA